MIRPAQPYTADEVARAAASAVEQGFPAKVEDPVALARIAQAYREQRAELVRAEKGAA